MKFLPNKRLIKVNGCIWYLVAILYKEGNFFRLPVCVPAHQAPSEKGSTLKGIQYLAGKANFLLLEQTVFKKKGGVQNNFDRLYSQKVNHFP